MIESGFWTPTGRWDLPPDPARRGRPLRRPDLAEVNADRLARGQPIRHVGAASIWVVGALIFFMYLVFKFITAADPADPSAFPLNVLIASDHAVYIGVITNIMLGLISLLVLDEAARRSWVGHVIFWGVNLGLLEFVIGLIVDTAEIKRIGAPVMGLTLYVALAILGDAGAVGIAGVGRIGAGRTRLNRDRGQIRAREPPIAHWSTLASVTIAVTLGSCRGDEPARSLEL